MLKYTCPCCGFPTLPKRGDYYICILCYWEDDGQDDEDADEVWGGPNELYSLTEARNNFQNHLWHSKKDYDRDKSVGMDAPYKEVKIKLIKLFNQLLDEDNFHPATIGKIDTCFKEKDTILSESIRRQQEIKHFTKK